jgi:hypothetical protein
MLAITSAFIAIAREGTDSPCHNHFFSMLIPHFSIVSD